MIAALAMSFSSISVVLNALKRKFQTLSKKLGRQLVPAASLAYKNGENDELLNMF